MYLVVDKKSRNVLGEFDNLIQAQSFFLDLVAADPSAAPDLKILGPRGKAEPIDPERVREAAGRTGQSTKLVASR